MNQNFSSPAEMHLLASYIHFELKIKISPTITRQLKIPLDCLWELDVSELFDVELFIEQSTVALIELNNLTL